VLGSRRFERARDGGIRPRLSKAERQLLRQLTMELSSGLRSSAEDPAFRRLFPPAFEDDADREREYRRLTRDELLQGRSSAYDVLVRSIDSRRLSTEQGEAWLRALNDLRLVLGTRLDVTEETFADGLDPSDPQAPDLGVYAYLTWLQEQLVHALAAETPAAG
jgi:hypothetical protein